jgi:serine/threonine protein kinase
MRVKDGESTQPFSFPSDVWSLGVTLVDFLMGKQFHQHLGKASVYLSFKKVMATNTVELHHPDFWDLVVELLAWDPEARPTAMELAQRFTNQEQSQAHEDERRISTGEDRMVKRRKL